jgi:hypothetical protein
LSARETSEYIRWRMRIAGARDENLFEPDALQAAHRFSSGIPRIINNICDNALLTGFGQGSPRITASIIKDVVEELDLTSIEIVSQPTVAETVVERNMSAAYSNQYQPAPDSQQAPAPNVRYIRRDASDTSWKSVAGDNVKSRFVIQPQNGDDSEAPLKFFSRVRVTRHS